MFTLVFTQCFDCLTRLRDSTLKMWCGFKLGFVWSSRERALCLMPLLFLRFMKHFVGCDFLWFRSNFFFLFSPRSNKFICFGSHLWFTVCLWTTSSNRSDLVRKAFFPILIQQIQCFRNSHFKEMPLYTWTVPFCFGAMVSI